VLHAPPISPSLEISAEQHDSHSFSSGDVAVSHSDDEGASDAVRLVADVSKDRMQRLRSLYLRRVSVPPLSSLNAGTHRHVTSQKRTLLSGWERGVPTSSVGVIKRFGSVRPAVCCRPHGQRSAAKHSHVRHCTLHCFRPRPTDTQFRTPEYKVPNMAGSLNLTPSTAHQIFCPRPFAKNAGVHVTWQILLSDSTQTVARSAEPANIRPAVLRSLQTHKYCTYTPANSVF